MGPRKLLQASNNRFLKKTNAERHAHTSLKQILSLPSAIVAQITQRFGALPGVTWSIGYCHFGILINDNTKCNSIFLFVHFLFVVLF